VLLRQALEERRWPPPHARNNELRESASAVACCRIQRMEKSRRARLGLVWLSLWNESRSQAHPSQSGELIEAEHSLASPSEW
jgi:hypothetical protein